MVAQDTKLTIGMAEITVGGNPIPRQADAAVFTAEPRLIEVDLYTAPVYDRRVEGWDVSVKIVVDEASVEGYKLALAGVEEITDETSSTVTGMQDGVGMKSLRADAQEVIIHPIEMGDDKSLDITIPKAVAIGSFERSYGKEVAGYEITLTGLHATGDHTKSGNYFRIGEEIVPV